MPKLRGRDSKRGFFTTLPDLTPAAAGARAGVFEDLTLGYEDKSGIIETSSSRSKSIASTREERSPPVDSAMRPDGGSELYMPAASSQWRKQREPRSSASLQ